MESSLTPGDKHVQRIVPSGFSEIMFYQKNVPESTAKDGYLKSRSQISGQKNTYFDLIISGNTKLLSIVFEPYGLSQFFDIPSSELLNQTIPLRFVLGKQLDELEDKVFKTDTTEQKIVIIENFFKKQLAKKKNYQLPRISNSVKEINSNSQNNPVLQLALNACLSRKQYERSFTNLVGISPKQFMRIVRFQRALFIKQNNPDIKLTELAVDAGYYDQSHMITDFKQLSGYTPKQYFTQCEPFSDYFSQF
jgi:AraC-like DNA-binding protein